MPCVQFTTHQAFEIANAMYDAIQGFTEKKQPYVVVYSQDMDRAVAMPDECDRSNDLGYITIASVGKEFEAGDCIKST